ncbi:VOC family protein [Amorphoplanes nipponensis]
MTLSGIVLDAPRMRRALAGFYHRLLGWSVVQDEPVQAGSAQRRAGAVLPVRSAYVPPVWPAGPGDPQMKVHLDIQSRTWPRPVPTRRRPVPARPNFQPQDDVRVYLDPDGHPFCLFL